MSLPQFIKKPIIWAAKKAGMGHQLKVLANNLRPEDPVLKRYKGIGKGKRCFVIGNGPSLNKLDLNLLKDEHTFAVNGIFLMFDKLDFLPTYYIVEDTLVAEDRADEINRLRGMKKFFPNFLHYVLTPDEDTHFMHVVLDYSNYPDFPVFSTNAARCMWVGGSVTFINLQLAFYFGYDPVIMIGFDHNYKVDMEKHTQESGTLTSHMNDINHFHPDYFGKGYRYHVPKVDRMEKGFSKARKVYDAHGRTILNATAGGHLEVFERVDYNSLFR